jgi:uncharacterized protein (DUF1778 family)
MDKRFTLLKIRISSDEKQKIKHAASRQKVTISDFVRLAVNEKTACIDGSDILTPRTKLAA